MNEISMQDVELAVKTIASTALRNEKYFSELDAAAGDADFGVSLASGFRAIENDWDQLDRASIGNFLLRISMLITRNVGGCSGPIWGTAFMRAGMLSKAQSALTLNDVQAMLTAAIEGIQQRGGAEAGDKTLLDALFPIRRIRRAGRRGSLRSAARHDPRRQRRNRTHQGLGRPARQAIVHRRPKPRHTGPRHRRGRDDDERPVRRLRRLDSQRLASCGAGDEHDTFNP